MKLLRYSKGSEQGHGILSGHEIFPLIHMNTTDALGHLREGEGNRLRPDSVRAVRSTLLVR